MNKLLAIDGTWLMRRAFAVKDKGFVEVLDENNQLVKVQDPKVVITAFYQSVLKKLKDLNYQYEVVLLWDRGSWKYRPKEKFKEYKADRNYDDTFQCCWDAINIAVELSREIGFKSIQVPGLEADDLAMFFSYYPSEVILYTADKDWKQCISENTKWHNHKNEEFSLVDILEDQITSPFDLAISKAINSEGHDNLAVVKIEKEDLTGIEGTTKHHQSIRAYKERKLDQVTLDAIDRNMHLSRLDRILHDEDTQKLVVEQFERKPNTKITNFNVSLLLHDKIGNYPAYFNGVLAKYNSIYNKGK